MAKKAKKRVAKKATKKTTKKKTTKKTTKKTGGVVADRELLTPQEPPTIVPAHALLARGSTVVPRTKVGAAVQAAISFENATRVIAEATSEGSEQFLVSWR